MRDAGVHWALFIGFAMSNPYIVHCDFAQFQQAVIDASFKQLVLLDLWAQWCAPCHVIAPILARTVEKLQGAVVLVKMDMDEDENMKIAGRYKVRGFPTVLLLKDGNELNRFYGAQTQSYVDSFLQPFLEK